MTTKKDVFEQIEIAFRVLELHYFNSDIDRKEYRYFKKCLIKKIDAALNDLYICLSE